MNGHFYAVALDGAGGVQRIKLGWAESPERRVVQLRKQRRAPDAVILKTWPARKTWETFLIVSATCAGCRRRGSLREEFYVSDVPALVARIEAAAAAHDLLRAPPEHGWRMAREAGLAEWWREVHQPRSAEPDR